MGAGKLVKVVTAQRGLNVTERKQVTRLAKRIVNTQLEEKNKDVVDTGTDVNQTARLIDICDIAEGSGSDQREGDKLMLQEVSGKLLMATQGATNDITRFIIFQWKGDSTHGDPDVGDVLHDNSNVPYLSRTAKESKLVNILLDKTIMTGASASNNPNNRVVHFRVYKGFAKTITYQVGGTEGKNKIYVMLLGNNNTNPPHSLYHINLKYRE